MKTTLSRRNWFKSSLALGTGLAFTPALLDSLMAAPVSEAERLHNLSFPGTDQLVRLGSNENPYGPSAKAREAVKNILNEGNRYTHTSAAQFKEILAKKEGVSPDYILMGAGSSELLCLAGMSAGLEGGSVLSAFPTFRLLMDYAVSLMPAGTRLTWTNILFMICKGSLLQLSRIQKFCFWLTRITRPAQ